MSTYNYESFPLDMDGPIFAGFRDELRPGMKAPDGELTDARTGDRVSLSDLWRAGPLIVEFGSAS